METYTFVVTLMDSGLPYPDRESAEKDAKEWAKGLGDSENCMVAQVQVIKDEVST